MTTHSERITLRASDGASISAYHVQPAGKRRGGLVVVQEIFGVNAHIRSVADRFAQHGYEVIAPALFDRIEPNVELGYDEAGRDKGRPIVGQLGVDKPLLDIQAAVDRLKGAGKVGVVGYCWGGSLSYLAAARVSGLSAAVGYYGSQIAKNLGDRPRVPTLLHFGDKDKSIPPEDIERIRSEQPAVVTHVYHAEHGFNCDVRSSYDKPSAELALSRTLSFFEEHVG